MKRLLLAAALTAAALPLAACGAGASSSASSSAPAAPASAPAAAAAASASCKLKTTFDYLERTTEPGLQPQASEIGNADYAACADSLATFRQEAGQADGECTMIAKASDNPGYDVNADPAPPLKDVIMSAGPGC
jgi:hypothetical protein